MKIIARTAKELLTIIRLQEQANKEATKAQIEYEDSLYRKYYDEHPTEAEANRVHAGAPYDDPEGELVDDMGIHPQDMRI